jgi:outer membrane lipoprotein SlyB
MSRYRWSLFYSFAVLITFASVSCSPPGQDLQSAKTAQTATTETINKGNVDAAPAEPPRPVVDAKPVEDVKPKRVESVKPAVTTPRAPLPVPSAPPAPAASPAPAPAPQPVASAPQPAPIVVPAPQADPIPVPGPPPPPAPTTRNVTIPAGTEVYIRMIDSINAERSHQNETFRASLDKDIVVDGKTIVPRRSDVFVKVVEVQTAGKLKGQSELQVQLDRLFIGKQAYTVASNTFTKTGDSEGKKAARNVGIGAAVGAALGGILGGGKGAVIGAGAGGGGGAVITKPDQLQIDSETQLMFKLDNPLDVTITEKPAGTTNNGSDGPVRFTVPPPDRDRSGSQASSRTPSNDNGDLTGNWTVTTDGYQSMTLQLNLRQNGNNLSGSITNPYGSGTLPIRGSVSGNYINFSTQSQYGGNNSQIQFSGAVDRDSMQGSATMPANNASYGGGYPGGGYPGGGYPSGSPGGGYPGGGRRRTGGGGGTVQLHWNAERN